jgi:uncharacterized membrane protein
MPDRLTYYWQLLAPVAFLPLAAPLVLLIGAPQAVINVTSGHALTHDFRFHYTSVVLAGVFLATVEGIAWLGRARLARRLLLVALLATSLAANVAWSPSPLGSQFDSGIWARAEPRHAVVKAALRLVPPDAGVSATYYLVPHLTHRVHVYEFPNPWVVTNWGAHGENPPDPATADYLVVDERLLGTQRPLYERLLSPQGGYAALYRVDGIVVAKRKP